MTMPPIFTPKRHTNNDEKPYEAEPNHTSNEKTMDRSYGGVSRSKFSNLVEDNANSNYNSSVRKS